MPRKPLKNKPLIEAIFEFRWELQEQTPGMKVDPHYKILGRHSSVTLSRSVLVLAKEMAEFLDLCAHSQTFDLYETNGKRAAITIRCGEHWHTEHDLIFLRQDLLDQYLQENNLGLLWAVWGERQFKSKNMEDLNAFAKEHMPHKAFQEIESYGDTKNC